MQPIIVISEVVKFYLSHVAGFAALAKAVVDLADRNWSMAITDLVAAGAAFGLNLKPAQQANTK